MVAYFTSSIIIDDIVMPDGRTALGMLGGGGPQSAFGMRLWTQQPIGLCGGIGPDFPPAAQAWLAALEIDTTGVRVDPVAPTPRAWQVMEWDGRRTQVWRTPNAATSHHLALRPDLVPAPYWQARGFHGGVHPEHPNLALLQALRGAGICVCLEPFRAAAQPLSDAAVRELVTHCDLFSPNLSEAASLVGPGDPDVLAMRLLDAGAPRVALRMGQEGRSCGAPPAMNGSGSQRCK
ncbi:MAG: hypothetical protein IPK16_08275 [Anaerolineales bacterium]|nr:hypothetical protein [Anaerolineales bacterium]